MSYTTLYLLSRTSVCTDVEYPNSWGFAMALWDALWGKYIDPGYRSPLHNGVDVLRPLWELARDKRVPLHLRLANAITFDRAYIPRERIADAAEALGRVHEFIIAGSPLGAKFSDGRPMGGDRSRINWSHWPFIAHDLRRLAGRFWRYGRASGDKRIIGVCFNGTSVNNEWYRWTKRREPLLDAWEYALPPSDEELHGLRSIFGGLEPTAVEPTFPVLANEGKVL